MRHIIFFVTKTKVTILFYNPDLAFITYNNTVFKRYKILSLFLGCSSISCSMLKILVLRFGIEQIIKYVNYLVKYKFVS